MELDFILSDSKIRLAHIGSKSVEIALLQKLILQEKSGMRVHGFQITAHLSHQRSA